MNIRDCTLGLGPGHPELPNNINGCDAVGENTELKIGLWFGFVAERPFDPTIPLTHAVSNIICSVVFGNRFDYEDQKFLAFINLTEENNELFRSFLGQVCSVVFSTLLLCNGGRDRSFFLSLLLFLK